MKNTPNTVEVPPGKTRATVLMVMHGVSFSAVAREAGTNAHIAIRSLDIHKFHTVGHGKVTRVRLATEKLLRDAGWSGDPAALWDEYDSKIELAA